MKPAPKKRSPRKPITSIIKAVIAGAGSVGISPRDIAKKTALPATTVSAWLNKQKKPRGLVKWDKATGKYTSSSKTALPTFKVNPTPLILPVIGAAGVKGITYHDIVEQTALDNNNVGIWLCENTAPNDNPVVEAAAYDKYVLTAQGKVNLKKLKGWVQAGDEIII